MIIPSRYISSTGILSNSHGQYTNPLWAKWAEERIKKLEDCMSGWNDVYGWKDGEYIDNIQEDVFDKALGN